MVVLNEHIESLEVQDWSETPRLPTSTTETQAYRTAPRKWRHFSSRLFISPPHTASCSDAIRTRDGRASWVGVCTNSIFKPRDTVLITHGSEVSDCHASTHMRVRPASGALRRAFREIGHGKRKRSCTCRVCVLHPL